MPWSQGAGSHHPGLALATYPPVIPPPRVLCLLVLSQGLGMQSRLALNCRSFLPQPHEVNDDGVTDMCQHTWHCPGFGVLSSHPCYMRGFEEEPVLCLGSSRGALLKNSPFDLSLPSLPSVQFSPGAR